MTNQNVFSNNEEAKKLEKILADYYDANFQDEAIKAVLVDYETIFVAYLGESDISLYETREKELLKSIRNLKKLIDFYSSEIEA